MSRDPEENKNIDAEVRYEQISDSISQHDQQALNEIERMRIENQKLRIENARLKMDNDHIKMLNDHIAKENMVYTWKFEKMKEIIPRTEYARHSLKKNKMETSEKE